MGCDNTKTSDGSLQCDFGAPSYSPDGNTIVVSRLIANPRGLDSGHGGNGALMLVGSDGANARQLARQTGDDEHPAFLPLGNELVFDGRTSSKPSVNLFTVSASGTGLRQLTSRGGSRPAPCPNRTVAFARRGDIYLLARL